MDNEIMLECLRIASTQVYRNMENPFPSAMGMAQSRSAVSPEQITNYAKELYVNIMPKPEAKKIAKPRRKTRHK